MKYSKIVNVFVICCKMAINKKKFKKCLPLLKILEKLSPSERQDLFGFLNEHGVHAITNCVENTLYNKDIRKATAPLRTELLQHKKQLKDLLNPKKSAKQKQRKLVQVGGDAIGSILSTLLPILMAFL